MCPWTPSLISTTWMIIQWLSCWKSWTCSRSLSWSKTQTLMTYLALLIGLTKSSLSVTLQKGLCTRQILRLHKTWLFMLKLHCWESAMQWRYALMCAMLESIFANTGSSSFLKISKKSMILSIPVSMMIWFLSWPSISSRRSLQSTLSSPRMKPSLVTLPRANKRRSTWSWIPVHISTRT